MKQTNVRKYNADACRKGGGDCLPEEHTPLAGGLQSSL